MKAPYAMSAAPPRFVPATVFASALLFAGCGTVSLEGRGRSSQMCLALSVGGLSGIAHLGALEVLQEERLHATCVVGNSMGSLVGSLYAYDPTGDTTDHFRKLIAQYVAEAEGEAAEGSFLGALLGGLLLGPVGGLAGGMLGGSGVSELDHHRLVRVLDAYLDGSEIQDLRIPFRTSFAIVEGGHVRYWEADQGNLAFAVGASVANPFVFPELKLAPGVPIDPGMDRLSSVPAAQACEAFGNAPILAVNVTGEPAVVVRGSACRFEEISFTVPEAALQDVLTDPSAFERVVELGRAATRAWLESASGRQFVRDRRRRRLEYDL
jgi:predicted acylesterase/phospholipase RssA